MSSASSLARRRRPRRLARPRPAPAPGPTSPSASTDQEWLWCDNHDTINQWFLTKPHIKYEEFYASFINFANRAWELSRCQDRAPLEGLQKFVVELLQKKRIPADELLTALQDYLVGQGDGKARWKEIGLVPFALGLGPQALNAGKDKLQAKVQGHLRKARNSLLLTRPRTSTTAANKATMADQKPLPTFVAPSSLPASAASTLPTPFVFGSLPYVGGKKVNKEDDMDIEE